MDISKKDISQSHGWMPLKPFKQKFITYPSNKDGYQRPSGIHAFEHLCEKPEAHGLSSTV